MDYSPLFSEHGLSFDRLRSFLEVVEAGGIAAATGNDPTRQSLYSRQIKELETFFGASLTKRKGRRLEITPEGNRLASLIRASFIDLTDFRADSRSEARRAIIAGGASVIEWLLSPSLTQCRKALADPIIETRILRSADICRALDDGRIDFGIVRREAVPPSLQTLEIGPLAYALFVPAKLAPPRKPGTTAQWTKLLSRLPQARLVEGSQLRRKVDEAHQASLIRPQIIAESTSLLQLAAIVRAGQAAAILPITAKCAFLGTETKTIALNGFLEYHRNLALAFSLPNIRRRALEERQIKSLAQAITRTHSQRVNAR